MTPTNRPIHYCGSLDLRVRKITAGWAACCSGDRAIEIKTLGQQTTRIGDVTCGPCLRLIDKHEQYKKNLGYRDRLVHAVHRHFTFCGGSARCETTLSHLCIDHLGPQSDDARAVLATLRASINAALSEHRLLIKYRPTDGFEIEVTRL